MSLSRENADVSVSPESRARDEHPCFDRAVQRVAYIVQLMAHMRWERGVTGPELAEDWGLSLTLVENYSTEARRHLELLGQREAVLNIVRSSAVGWVQQSDNDRVQAARLLVDTVGGFAQKHEVKLEAKQPSPTELEDGCAAWLREHAPQRLLREADELRGLVLTEGEEK